MQNDANLPEQVRLGAHKMLLLGVTRAEKCRHGTPIDRGVISELLH